MHPTLVLNLDENPDSRVARRRILEASGLDVADADDSRAALAAAGRQPDRPLLVLLREPAAPELPELLRTRTAAPVYTIALRAAGTSCCENPGSSADLRLADDYDRADWAAVIQAFAGFLERRVGEGIPPAAGAAAANGPAGPGETPSGAPSIREAAGTRRPATGDMPDVTEAVLQELRQQLAMQVNRFETLFGLAPIGIMLVEDPEGRRIRLNPALERLLGVKSGTNPWIGGDQDALPRLRFLRNGRELTVAEAPLAVVLETGRPVEHFELDIEFPDGRVVNQLGHAVPLLDGSGRLRGAAMACLDISLRKQAEEELRRQKEILESILDNVPVMIDFVDAAGDFRFVNRCFTDTLGWSLEDCRQRDILADLYPDPVYRSRVMDYIRNSSPGFADFDTRTRDGGILQTSWANVALSDGTIIGLGIDVTAQRRAKADKNRLIEIVEAATDVISTADLEGRITYLNRAGRRLFGQSPDFDVRSTRIADYHPDWAYRKVLEEAIPEAVQRGAWTGDTALVSADGAEVPMSQQVIAHRNALGAVESFSNILRDITERKRAEQALSFDRALFEGLQTAAPVGLGFVDWNLRIIRLNQALADFNGLPIAAHIGRPLADVVPELWPVLRPVLTRVLERGEVVANLEVAGETPAQPGVRRHWLAGFYPLQVGGEIVAGGIVVQDITERIRAEEALRNSERRLDMARMGAELGFWEWEVESGRICLDDRWSGVLGSKPEAAVESYEQWIARIHPDDREEVVSTLERHLAGATPHYEAEYRFRMPDERWIWAASRGRVLDWDAAGKARLVAGMYRDISARKGLEERLKLQQEQLLHAQRLNTAGELVALIGHELNQPLSAINNYLGGAILRFRKPLADHPELAHAIHEALRLSRRAAEVISGLRDLVRGHDVEKEWVKPAALVHDCLLLANAELRQHQISVDLQVPASLPSIWGQRVHLQQLLLNLILNALEALHAVPPEGRRLAIQAENVPGSELELRIADSGPGIAAAVAGNLFEPFVSTKPGGIGLGLSICRTIVEAHGGHITAATAPERGAEFRIRLPVPD